MCPKCGKILSDMMPKFRSEPTLFDQKNHPNFINVLKSLFSKVCRMCLKNLFTDLINLIHDPVF